MPEPTELKSSNMEFWSQSTSESLANLNSSLKGLTKEDAKKRLAHTAQSTHENARPRALSLFVSQFKSPIILILLFAVCLSLFLRDFTNAIIILFIVLASGILGFWQEYAAADAVQKLLAVIEIKSTVVRDGISSEISIKEIVPGDIIQINAGDVIPGDSLLLESKNLFVNEATLTGETFPAEKTVGVLPREAPISQRTNTLFTGTYAVSGTATALVVRTGTETEFGKVSETLKLRPPETEFERGIRQFGYLLMEVTLLLVISIFAINVYLHRPVLESFLFSLALAVGLTPQLLPAIISVNLAHGAKRMAEAKVIVKRLSAIQNFGSMNILCSDKTGTLTEGEVQLKSAVNVEGQSSDKTLLFAQLNAFFQSGYSNPIDKAIVDHSPFDHSEYKKLDEEPYDFVRKRLSVLVGKGDASFLVTKGALSNILDVCKTAETTEGKVVELSTLETQIQARFKEFSEQGFRVVGVSYRNFDVQKGITKADEKEMTFLGFLVLFDPLKEGTLETVQKLRKLGLTFKLITGDNRLVAAHIGQQAGLSIEKLLTGPELRDMSQEALRRRVNEVEVFAEIEPNQKERIVLALKQSGHVVGCMGDGINDAPALHAADVGISVANAVDVAKAAADIVLLEKDLKVLEQGVREGRITFANTLKYVFMATSANFGNMFSMAGASLFLPFLPLLPTQILLTNLLTDLPEMTIATDSVDGEMVEKPRRWDIGFIRRFMLVFGLVSSVFDYLTFGVLRWILHANPQQFRTGWFMESVISASLVVFVIRTRKSFYRSRPGKYLTIATLSTIIVSLVLPYTPFAGVLGFQPVPPIFILALALILIAYILVAETAKFYFYRDMSNTSK